MAKRRLVPLNWKFQKYLNKVVDDIFVAASAKKIGVNELAKRANLAVTTVQRLFWHETKTPHLRTVYKLAIATGMTALPPLTAQSKKGRKKVLS